MAGDVPKIQAILFDFFGTLVDYTSDRRDLSYEQSFELFRQSCPGWSYETYCEQWDESFKLIENQQMGREFLMQEVAELVLQRLGVETAQFGHRAFMERWVDAFMADWSKDIKIMSGALGLLNRLSNHYQLALISNTHHPATVYRLMEAFDLTPLFKVVTLSAEWGYAKPHGSIFETTLTKMAIAPQHAAYVGDSFEADYCGATDAGLIGYLIGRHARVPRDRQLRNLQDLAIYFDTTRR